MLGRFWQKKNHLFRWSSFWSWRVCKLSNFAAQKIRTYTLKSRRTQNESLFQRHYWVIFEAIATRLRRLLTIPISMRSKNDHTSTVDSFRTMLARPSLSAVRAEYKSMSTNFFWREMGDLGTFSTMLNIQCERFEGIFIYHWGDVNWPP